MAMITRDELEKRFGADEIAGLADRDGDAAEDTGAVDAAIADAEAEVISYVRVVIPYPIPDPAPDILRRITGVIARYNLWRRDTREDHPAYIAYKDAVRELRDIAAGKVVLPDVSTGDDTATSAGGAVRTVTQHFTDTVMERMLPVVRP